MQSSGKIQKAAFRFRGSGLSGMRQVRPFPVPLLTNRFRPIYDIPSVELNDRSGPKTEWRVRTELARKAAVRPASASSRIRPKTAVDALRQVIS